MFTRRPLGGMSCASCEKNVINMYGNKAEYLPWGKMPYRDPSERIARMGKGFSKMLSMMNSQVVHNDGGGSRINNITLANQMQGNSNNHSVRASADRYMINQKHDGGFDDNEDGQVINGGEGMP